MPTEFHHKTFAAWGKQLGDVIYTSVVGRPAIILNSAEAARDLMDKQSANFSDRPRTVLHGELYGLKNMMPFLTYGDQFRAQRRLMQQHLNSQAVASYRALQVEQVRILLRNLLASPGEFIKHVNRMSTGTLMMATYGHKVESDNDAYAMIAVEASSLATEGGAPGASLVDFIPILRYAPSWFPGAGFQKRVARTRQANADMVDMPYENLKERRARGTNFWPSLISDMLDKYESRQVEDPAHEVNMKNVGGIIYGAGVETTEVAVTTFMLMMVRHPEVVKKAQAEIDRVVGADRLPTYDDRPNLPYVECILKEAFRINPPLPLGIPHQSMKEEVYRGWCIPAGSMIVPNIWQMMRDEKFFPNPEQFSPKRFLDKISKRDGDKLVDATSGLNSLELDDPSSLVFGFGRRICPGRFFADASVWLAIVNILAAFDIKPPLDPDSGQEKIPNADFCWGVTSKPKAFQCQIVPRNVKYTALISEDL
ncbi:cytochrome P450 [Phellopilus nigrolimitatus]|nr:cytochrome P450 [Phellopilus nigrolimitatus]